MGKSLFIDVSQLERRKLEFDASFEPARLSLPDNWKLVADLNAAGAAELLDKHGSRTIRIRGRIDARLGNTCARCLNPVEESVGGEFELFFYPTSLEQEDQESSLSRDDVDIGYYEDPGLPLVDAIREQLLLWLPMRELCRDDCKGICPQCGADRNEKPCACHETSRDDRWDALRGLKLN